MSPFISSQIIPSTQVVIFLSLIFPAMDDRNDSRRQDFERVLRTDENIVDGNRRWWKFFRNHLTFLVQGNLRHCPQVLFFECQSENASRCHLRPQACQTSTSWWKISGCYWTSVQYCLLKLSSIWKWNTEFRLSTIWWWFDNGLLRLVSTTITRTFKIWRAQQASPDSTLRSTLLQRHWLGTDHSSIYHRIFYAFAVFSLVRCDPPSACSMKWFHPPGQLLLSCTLVSSFTLAWKKNLFWFSYDFFILNSLHAYLL